MKALHYKITIHESVVAGMHGFGETIEEIYIPELDIAFNAKHFAFKTDLSRYTKATLITEIDLDDDFVAKVQSCVKTQEIFVKASDDFFANLK